jgi:uncharacterized membrane protein YbhN (UPF0104 family)
MIDRLSAILGLVGLSLLSFPMLLSSGDPMLGWSAMAVAVIFVAGTALFFAIGPAIADALARRWSIVRRVHNLLLFTRQYLLSRAGLCAIFLSFILYSSTAGAVMISARAFSIPIHTGAVVAIVPVSLLLSAIPISLAGWGIREASMVVGFSAFGMPPEDATLLSVWLGLSILLSSIPGGILWGCQRFGARG